MDSGCAVPTLNPGVSDTVAVKFLIVASVRGGATARAGSATGGAAGAAFRLARSARFLALDNAGNSMAAMTAMMAMTTMSSINVKAWERIFIRMVLLSKDSKHQRC